MTSELLPTKLLINGSWVSGEGSSLESVMPHSGEVLWQGCSATAEQVGQAVEAAREAFVHWSLTSITERQAIIVTLPPK